MTAVSQVANSPFQAGAEPIPGYRLIEPLGRGGFGEVWKCTAPGGVIKAIKFVVGSRAASSPVSQERAALERVKSLRHPFLLSLDRLEILPSGFDSSDSDLLVIVMEMADQSLYSLQGWYRERGMVGLPREELLSYLVEAAEALDWMNFEHGLQHLDVKPHNLFLLSNHVKVADFGLVSQLSERGGSASRRGGVTPLYSAPELLRGTLSRHSDQYSLAVVYQQLLTGTVPFWHENVYELMMQHLAGEPDLVALSEQDREVVARALAKSPEMRYPSCMDFIQSLMNDKGQRPRRSDQWRKMLEGVRGDPLPKTGPQESASNQTPSSPHLLRDGLPQVQQREFTPTRRIRVLPPGQLRNELVPAQPAPREQAPPVSPPPVEPSSLVHKPEPTPIKTPLPEGLSPVDDLLVEVSEGWAEEKYAPTAISLPGFRFLNCLSQGPMADLWQAEDAQGQMRRATCLLGFVQYDARLIEHLRALRDRVLPPNEVHWSPAERLVILAPWFEGTLRDRFEKCQSQAQAGISRDELLRLLRSAAEALDVLYARHGLQHMGLHPRNLLVDGNKLWLGDFGLVPLVWLPSAQTTTMLNGRYAAPEMFDRRPGRTADQFSLGLIYTEMLTGVPVRIQRPGSGGQKRVGTGPLRSVPYRPEKYDLDMLPAHDRDLVQRALAYEPDQRYPSCTAFIEALEKAVEVAQINENLYTTLPGVIPAASLEGVPPNPETVLPALTTLVSSLATVSDPRTVMGPQNLRYVVRSDGIWEYRCPVQLFTGALELRLEGLRTHWNARIQEQSSERYRLHIDVPVPRSLWERVVGQVRRLELEITVDPNPGAKRLTEAMVRLSYPSDDPRQTERVMAKMGPSVFESVRKFLQSSPEQRSRERWPLKEVVRIYPVMPDLELAQTLEGVCKNISYGGISFRTEKKPPVEYLYVHLYESATAEPYAMLVRMLRAVQTPEGVEIGAVFVNGTGG